MELKDKGYTLHKKGLKNSEIAERLGVSLNTVKSWSRRYWKDADSGAKNAPKKRTRKGAKSAPVAPKKKKGAPPGNLNGVGNCSGGAPVGNHNALKHGGYAEVMFGDWMAEHRKTMEESETPTEEELLMQEIDLLTLRERYLLERIKACEPDPGKTDRHFVRSIRTDKEKMDFKRLDEDAEAEKADREKYIWLRDQAVVEGKLWPGAMVNVSTTTESGYERMERLERLLTQVQRQKSRVIGQLIALRKEQANTNDIEDLSDIRRAVFGDDYIDQDPDV